MSTTLNTESANAQQDDDHHLNHDFDLTPPAWWDRAAPPPPVDAVNEDDELDIEAWLDPFADDPNSIIWRGTTWSVSTRGVERIDQKYSIAFDDVWSVDAVKGALAIEPIDHDDLREALRIARLIDAFWGTAS